MIIHDRIYGSWDIIEPVLIELIHTSPIERLKHIHQAGPSQYLAHWKDVTRYEHSIGVMILLRKFGAVLNEQIAGLLHDVPHTAYSHVADFVFENRNHEYHELFHESIIEKSEIAGILKKHEISKKVIHPEFFSLLEQNIPELCADRIDYALRDFFSWKKDNESVQAKLLGLIVHDGTFMFRDIYSAEAFATDYLEMDAKIWADPTEIAMYELMAQAIRHALDKHILTKEDLFTTDQRVYQILKLHGDPYIHKKLAYLTPSFRTTPATKEHHHLFVKTKTRYVDPKIVTHSGVKRLSELSKKFKTKLENRLKSRGKGSYIFISEN